MRAISLGEDIKKPKGAQATDTEKVTIYNEISVHQSSLRQVSMIDDNEISSGKQAEIGAQCSTDGENNSIDPATSSGSVIKWDDNDKPIIDELHPTATPNLTAIPDLAAKPVHVPIWNVNKEDETAATTNFWETNEIPEPSANEYKKQLVGIPTFATEGIDLNDDESYGFNEQYLAALRIQPPLKADVFVKNLHLDLDVLALRNIFSAAGIVHTIKIFGCEVMNMARIEYDHPIEAVQAISMFDSENVHGRIIKVSFAQVNENRRHKSAKPKWYLGCIGYGLGPKGAPLYGIRTKIQLERLKRTHQRKLSSIQQRVAIIKSQITEKQKEFDNKKLKAAKNAQAISASAIQPLNQIAGLTTMITNAVQSSLLGMLNIQVPLQGIIHSQQYQNNAAPTSITDVAAKQNVWAPNMQTNSTQQTYVQTPANTRPAMNIEPAVNIQPAMDSPHLSNMQPKVNMADEISSVNMLPAVNVQPPMNMQPGVYIPQTTNMPAPNEYGYGYGYVLQAMPPVPIVPTPATYPVPNVQTHFYPNMGPDPHIQPPVYPNIQPEHFTQTSIYPNMQLEPHLKMHFYPNIQPETYTQISVYPNMQPDPDIPTPEYLNAQPDPYTQTFAYQNMQLDPHIQTPVYPNIQHEPYIQTPAHPNNMLTERHIETPVYSNMQPEPTKQQQPPIDMSDILKRAAQHVEAQSASKPVAAESGTSNTSQSSNKPVSAQKPVYTENPKPMAEDKFMLKLMAHANYLSPGSKNVDWKNKRGRRHSSKSSESSTSSHDRYSAYKRSRDRSRSSSRSRDRDSRVIEHTRMRSNERYFREREHKGMRSRERDSSEREYKRMRSRERGSRGMEHKRIQSRERDSTEREHKRMRSRERGSRGIEHRRIKSREIDSSEREHKKMKIRERDSSERQHKRMRSRERDSREKDHKNWRSRERDTDVTSCAVLFKNLPPNVNVSNLKEKMQEFGSVTDATCSGAGRACVVFKRKEAAQACINRYHQSTVDGRKIEAYWPLK